MLLHKHIGMWCTANTGDFIFKIQNAIMHVIETMAKPCISYVVMVFCIFNCKITMDSNYIYKVHLYYNFNLIFNHTFDNIN